MTDKIGIRDQGARRFVMRAEDADWFAGLNQERLVVLEIHERAHDRIERFPTARGPSGAAVNDELRSEEHTSELQSRPHLVCRLLLEKKKKINQTQNNTLNKYII